MLFKKLSLFIALSFILFSCKEDPGVLPTPSKQELFSSSIDELYKSVSSSMILHPEFSKLEQYAISHPTELKTILSAAETIPELNAIIKDDGKKALQGIDDIIALIYKNFNPTLATALSSLTKVDLSSLSKSGDAPVTSFLETLLKATLKDEVKKITAPLLKENRAELGGKSATSLWSAFVTTYNLKVKVLGGTVIPSVDLDEFVTDFAVDLLFKKLAETEENFKKDPNSSVSKLMNLL